MKNVVTGSNMNEASQSDSLDSLIFELCTQEFLTESFRPGYRLKENAKLMYMCPSTFCFFSLKPGSEIIPLEDFESAKDDILILSGFKTLLVPIGDIEKIGWN